MAVSAFKSTSRRGDFATPPNTTPSAKQYPAEDLGKKISSRRSRSVSAMPSSRQDAPAPSSISEFSNKMDNPLFCTSSASPTDSEKSMATVERSSSTDVSDDRRGRSVSRGTGLGSQCSAPEKEWGRSTGRRGRSVSRGHYRNLESEIEEGEGCSLASTFINKRLGSYDLLDGWKITNTTHDHELSKQTRNLQTWSSQHPHCEPLDRSSSNMQISNWDDEISTSSFSEAEEKTIKAVCEQMKSFHSDHPLSDVGGGIYETVRSEVRRAVSEIRNDLETAIHRKNPAVITMGNVADIPPGLVNPDAIELVSDIRRQYAIKLAQCQERARKLQEDLDIEERRGQELIRILKEILPDPKCSEMQKSRPKRKTSIERRKMSRRLTEEAMNYFDECVSISTFDGSDFSSLEDPPPSSVDVTPPMGSGILFSNGGSSSSTTNFLNAPLHRQEESASQNQRAVPYLGADLTATSSFSSVKDTNLMQANNNRENLVHFDTPRRGNYQFSFAPGSMESLGAHDLRHYIKKFGKELQKGGTEHANVRSSYNADDYDLTSSAESLLFEKLILRNRIDSGGLLVCDVRIF